MKTTAIKIAEKLLGGMVAALIVLLLISFLPLENWSQPAAYSQNATASTDGDKETSLQEYEAAEIAPPPQDGAGASPEKGASRQGEIVMLQPTQPLPKGEPKGEHRKEQGGAAAPRPEIIEPALANEMKAEGVEEKEVEVLIRIADSEAEGAAGVLATTASRIASERVMMEAAAEELEKAGAKVEGAYPIGNIIVAKVKVSELEQITKNKKVEMISANREVRAVLSESVPQIEAQAFWNAGFKGNGVRIAILDTGIDASHPMLAGKVVAEKAFTGEDHTTDLNGHGTHVAGTAAGTKAAGGGYDGVAPEAVLMNGKVLNDAGSGSTAGIVAGINWAVDPDGNPETDDGADIISMSLGGAYNYPYDPMSGAIKEAVEAGVLVVVASGNCGACGLCGGYKGVTTPGTSPWAFTVGAVDKGNEIACFSGGGVIDAVGVKPDITAPGVGIKSSVPGGYSAYQGTSMATPHVSGAAALLLQKNPALNPGQVIVILENTATDRGTKGKDTSYGTGTLNLSTAFRAKAAIKATNKISADMLMGEEVNEEIILYNFGSEPLYINVSHDSWIKFTGLPESPFQIEPTRNITAKYRITASEVGTGTHNGEIVINTSDQGLPNASVSISIRIFESTAPKFEEVTFPALAFSREELELGTSVTDNGVVSSVIVKIKSPEDAFGQVEAGLEKVDEKRWHGLLRMPTVSSSKQAVLEVTATDNDGHASVFWKEMKITNLVVEIKGKDKITQGSTVEMSTIFVNTADAAKDVFAEFEIIGSLGITAFRSVDGSVTLPTGFKGSFAANWTPENYGNYVVNVTIKGASEEVLANSTESLTVTLPQWGSIQSVKLPGTIIKGETLSYEVQFGNSGPAPFEAIAALSIIDEHQKVKLVMPSEEKEVPAGGSAVFSASAEKLSLSGGNYTAILQVFYGNREEAVEKPLKVTAPETLEIALGLAKGETEYGSESLRYTVTARNTGTMPLFAEFNASVYNSQGGEAYSARFNGSEVAAGESLEISSEINATELSVGSYSLAINANYEGNSVNTQTQFGVRDTVPPLLEMVNLPKAVRQYEPVVAELSALDYSPVVNISAKLVTEGEKTLGESNASPARENLVIFNTAETGEHLLILEACDAYNNCNISENVITVEECASRKALIINARNDQRQIRPLTEETLSSNTCIYEYNTTNGILPDSGYLAHFAAVVWTSGNSPRAVPQHYQKLMMDYMLKGGSLLVEGSDIAFRHRNDEFMQNITHSILVETMTVSLPGSPEASPQEGKSLNITRAAPHHITFALPETFSYQPPDQNRNPDEVLPLNEAGGLLKWGEGDGYAAVAYEAKAEEPYKTAFLPLDITGLNEETAKKILADTTEWLLLESSPSDIRMEVAHGRLVEGDNEINLTITEKTGSATTAKVVFEVNSSRFYSQEIEMPGGSNTIRLAVPLTAGEHTIRAAALAPMSEQDYKNNEVSYKAYVAPKLPDVTVKGVAYAYEAATKTVEINVTAANRGGTAAETDIMVFIGDNFTGTARLSLQAGEEANYSFNGGTAAGKRKITAKAENAEDANYANNQLTIEANFCSKERILIVDDNDTESYATSNPSSAPEIARILDENGYCAELWGEAEKGLPPNLNTFPAVVWSAGDYLQAITSSEEAELLKDYRGGLLLEGSDIAADLAGRGNESLLRELSGTAFVSDILIPQTESRTLNMKEHTILEGVGALEIKGNNSPYPDAVEALDAEVVAEWQDTNGTAAITASNTSRKTVYYAFSVDGITDAAAMEKLVTNTVEWLLVKPNSPPLIQNLSDDAVAGEISDAAIKITMNEGQTRNFSVLAEDPDGDPLTYKWMLNGTPVSTTYYFAFSPKHNESGSYNITVIVSDGQAEARAELLVTVLDTMECDPARQTRLCQLQFGVCTGSNVTCDSKGKWPSCTAATYLGYNSKYEVTEASCDGLDNDCDGLVDEGFGDVDDDELADCVDKDNDNDDVEDDEDDFIGNETHINFTGDAGDEKKLKIRVEDSEDEKEKVQRVKFVKLNHSDKPLLQFRFNFSNGNILLRNLSIEKQKNDSKEGFTLVRGLDLKGKRKQVFVDRLVNGSNAVCIKDKEVSAITEVTSGCSGDNESLLQCDFPTTGPPYARTGWTCGGSTNEPPKPLDECEPLFCQYVKETSQYQIYGLKHSAVMEACADADLDTYLPVGCSGGTDCNDNNGLISPAAAEVCNGVDDNCNGQIDENRVCNIAPEMQSVGNKTVSENGTLSFAVATTDNENDALAYNATKLPQGATFDNATAAFSWVPSFAQAGVYAVTFNISDGLAHDYETINITVANTNRAPVFETVGNKTVLENATLSFTVSATDPDGDSLAQLFVNVPEKLASAQFSLATKEFKWIPTFDDSGSYTIWFTASDGQLSTNEFVNVTVVNVNRPPRFENLTNQTVFENSTLRFFLNFTDPDMETLSASMTAPARLSSAELQGDVFTWVPTFDDAGQYEVVFAASDGNLSASASVNVTVLNVNRAPVISNVYGSFSANETGNATITVLADDPDGESLTFTVNDSRFVPAATAISGGGGGIGRAREFVWQTGYDDAGSYVVLATASDGSLAARYAVTVMVDNVNRPPVVAPMGNRTVGNRTVNENSTVVFLFDVTDPDNDTLLVEVTNVSGNAYGFEFDAETHEFTWTPTFDQAGEYAFMLTASDGNLSVTELFNATVLNVNRAPYIGSIQPDPPGLVMGEGEAKRFRLVPEIFDPDGDKFLSLWYVNGGLLSNRNDYFNFAAGFNSNGTYNITLVATDNMSAATIAVMQLTVQDTMQCVPLREKKPCQLQLGVCAGSAETCNSSGNWPGCTATNYLGYSGKYEEAETACDGLDNDCDGQVDEDPICTLRNNWTDVSGTWSVSEAGFSPVWSKAYAEHALVVEGNETFEDVQLKANVKVNFSSPQVGLCGRLSPDGKGYCLGYGWGMTRQVTLLRFNGKSSSGTLNEPVRMAEGPHIMVGSSPSDEELYLKLQLSSNTLKGKVWPVGSPEPDWQVESTADVMGEPLSSGFAGYYAYNVNATFGYYSAEAPSNSRDEGGECSDGDGDGQQDAGCGGTDCDDSDESVYMGAGEGCNSMDDDCDTEVDEGCALGSEAGEWNIVNGNWAYDGDKMVPSSYGYGGHPVIVRSDGNFSNGTISVTATNFGGKNEMGLCGRMSADGKGYCLGYGGGGLGYVKLARFDGFPYNPATIKIGPDIGVRIGQPYKLKLLFNGSAIKGKVWRVDEEEPDWQVQDRGSRYSAGSAGYYTYYTNATFENLAIERVD